MQLCSAAALPRCKCCKCCKYTGSLGQGCAAGLWTTWLPPCTRDPGTGVAAGLQPCLWAQQHRARPGHCQSHTTAAATRRAGGGLAPLGLLLSLAHHHHHHRHQQHHQQRCDGNARQTAPTLLGTSDCPSFVHGSVWVFGLRVDRESSKGLRGGLMQWGWEGERVHACESMLPLDPLELAAGLALTRLLWLHRS